MKKTTKYLLGLGALGVASGVIASVDIGGGNPQRGLVQGFSEQMPLAGSVLGATLVFEGMGELKKYTKKSNGGF